MKRNMLILYLALFYTFCLKAKNINISNNTDNIMILVKPIKEEGKRYGKHLQCGIIEPKSCKVFDLELITNSILFDMNKKFIKFEVYQFGYSFFYCYDALKEEQSDNITTLEINKIQMDFIVSVKK